MSLLLLLYQIRLTLKASRSYPGFLAKPAVTKAARNKEALPEAVKVLCSLRCGEQRVWISFHFNMNSGTGMALVESCLGVFCA